MHEHTFELSKDHEGYEVCIYCGTFHSIAQEIPEMLYENNYWDGDKHSTFNDQKYNLTEDKSCGISKVDKVLEYIPIRRMALEIGCSPGSLLRRLSERGYYCIGIEPDKKYIPEILAEAPYSQILHGYFPECCKKIEDGALDYIIAMDVLEHCDEYESFIKGIYRLLSIGGKAILMLPLVDECRDIDYLPSEHCWIFSKQFIEQYLKEMFSEVKFDLWQAGHSMIILTK